MDVVEDPNKSKRVPADKVFDYSGGKPVIGDTIEAHFSKHTILGDGRVREEGGGTYVLGRRFYLTGGHCLGHTDYRNGKVVFRCVHCGTYRTATASASPEAKFFILGWFMNNECAANQNP